MGIDPEDSVSNPTQPGPQMILPKESPYKDRLHSYYLVFENFVVAMQEEIGSGCIYCRSPRQSHRVFFLPDALGRCVVENRGQPPRIYHQLGDVISAFKVLPFIVSVYYLDRDAVDFWSRLPPYQKIKTPSVRSGSLSLDSVIASFQERDFSGFFDITAASGEGGLLFFQNAKMIGGSFSWGRGGLRAGKEDVRRLADLFRHDRCSLEIAAFTPPD